MGFALRAVVMLDPPPAFIFILGPPFLFLREILKGWENLILNNSLSVADERKGNSVPNITHVDLN